MDKLIQRKKQKIFSFIPVTLTGGLLLSVAVYYLLTGHLGSPVLDKDTLRIGEVKRGPFSVQVVGNGQIAAKDPDWVVARVEGQVIKAPIKSGQLVSKGDVLLELSNDNVAASYAKSQSDLQAAQADLNLLIANLDARKTELQAAVIHARLDHKQIKARYDALTRLKTTSVIPIPELEYVNTQVGVEQAEGKLEVARLELNSFHKIATAQASAAEFRFATQQQETERIKKQFENLIIRATRNGIVQNININPGENINTSTPIAQIVDPDSVYITLSVPAIQAAQLAVQQKVELQINRKQVQGYVHRVDPNIKGSTVDVDVYLNNARPDDAKIGMYVTGTIYIQSIAEALYVEIPAGVAEKDSMSVYLINKEGNLAQLTAIKSGALSAHYLQIIDGLAIGDKIVLSEISDRESETFRLN
ncbi:MAG TPA: HlyD family efflux transporter periplasmic adaptor subunit [Cellvibrio sp.]|nr:HlyD family efflux transporter periplasmic adaptor subunit [Cellvibrio sp.]